jgi:hypothetical protein
MVSAATIKLLTIVLLAAALGAPAFAFEVRPNPAMTGGSVRTDGHDGNATCGHSKAHRGSMSRARRDDILTRYGLPPGTHPDYEIDHLIPLCLGGSDDSSNLWPEPRRSIEPKSNAEAKDRLERFICDMVCNRQLAIGTAQEAFAKDWIAAYHKYLRGPLRSQRMRSRRKRAPAGFLRARVRDRSELRVRVCNDRDRLAPSTASSTPTKGKFGHYSACTLSYPTSVRRSR